MNIDVQKAETIYNISGNMFLDISPDIIKLLEQKEQSKLADLYSISYLDILHKSYLDKKIIERNSEISMIKSMLKENRQLIIFGEPGIGKTTLLLQLSRELENVIYISIKNKSPISVILYLINKIKGNRKEELLKLENINQAFDWLQVAIQNSNFFFIIDDCEHDKDFINKIISLEKFNTTFLFATRNKTFFEVSRAKFHHCTCLNEKEIKAFLDAYGLSVGHIEFNNIVYFSKGNPLYLFYFSQFSISPLPINLLEFQNSIWRGLSTLQQEILTLISIPHSSLKIIDITEVLAHYSPIQISNEIDSLSSLLKNYNSVLEIFHPSFKEFIINYLNTKSILNFYKEKLGDYFLKKEEIIQAIYLLIEIAHNKVDNYLIDTLPTIIKGGELNFAVKVLNTKLITSKKYIEKGYLHYHLCNVHHLLGNRIESSNHINQSLEYFKKSKNQKWYNIALVMKAMDLVEKGQVIKANEIIDKILTFLKESKDFSLKGSISISISKIYVDLSEFEKGAAICKEGFEIFEKEGNKEGMQMSLVNLVSCLSQIDEYLDIAEKYGLHLLKSLEDHSDFSIKAIVLNALTSIYRQKDEFEKAKEVCSLAIKLCQQFNMKDKVILNLINYGNIFKDERKFEDAKRIYSEALIKAQDYNLKKDEGRIYWLLAYIYKEEGLFELSLEFADKSINTNSEINFYFGIAYALREKAEVYLLLKEDLQAAELLVNSSIYYDKIENFSYYYQSYLSEAIKIFINFNELEKSQKYINELIENKSNKVEFKELIDLVVNISKGDSLIVSLEKIFINYTYYRNNNSNTIKQFLNLAHSCKRGNKSKSIFFSAINLLIKYLGTIAYSHSILGVIIEQSGSLLDITDLTTILNSLQEKLPMFFVREINDEKIIVTSIKNILNLEIHLPANNSICIKLLIALSLVLHEEPSLIIDKNKFKETICTLLIYPVDDEVRDNLNKGNGMDGFDNHKQTLHIKSRDYIEPNVILVNDNYESNCNLIEFPENTISFYFLVSTLTLIKNHSYHINITGKKREIILKGISYILDYRPKNEVQGKAQKLEFEINIDKV